jgi:23S rRNA (cytosine1962-C5)-methyltransferase
MQEIVLRRTSRVLSGHPWVFSNELSQSPKGFRPGSIVRLKDMLGRFLGIGYINPNSLISIRMLTRQDEPIDKGFFHARLKDAIEYRKRVFGGALPDSFRAVFSESDSLPGLIVDKYSDCLSVQVLTFGMEALKDLAMDAVADVFSPKTIVLRNDSPARALEGLGLEKAVLKGSLSNLPVITEGGASFEVDPLNGQKTGFFLDQRENRLAFQSIVSGGEGLDLFCYTGAWAVGLALKGAKVTGIDASGDAVSQASRNALMNSVAGRCSFVKADVFEFLKKEEGAKKRYDFMVVDPPAFVKSKAKIKEALIAYRTVNAGAMRLLKKNGVLATSSCSYHIGRESFYEAISQGARDAGRQARVIQARGQAKDHPTLLSAPETDYLKCLLLQMD